MVNKELPDVPSIRIEPKPSPSILAYWIPQSLRSQTMPVAPSLFIHCQMAIESMDEKPEWFERCGLLGKLQILAPSAESGAYMAQFALPNGHTSLSSEAEVPEGILTLPVTAEVADCVINSGALMALDTVCWGRLVDGVLEELVLYIETDR